MSDEPPKAHSDIPSALLEAAPDAMVIVNADGRIVLVNAQAERAFGFRREELIGRTVEALVPERYGAVHTRHRLTYVSRAHPRPMGQGLDLFGRRKDGSEFPVEISLSPLQTDDGLLIVSAIRDITDRRAAEAERQRLLQERAAHAEASRIKDQFLATLSHELRTPLNAVLGWVSLINTGTLSDEEVRRGLETIARNACAQAQLVEDLLDVSRIVSGKLQITATAMDLAEVADAAVDVVRPAADAKRIEVRTRIERRPVLIMGDADRLQQVLWNLLSNAVKFTPPRGRVELQIEGGPRGVQMTVRDTGEGIPQSFLPHMFDRFRQADASSTRAHGGLGLGLSIAKSIVELHGGTIQASSPGPSQGSTISVHLPVARIAERRRLPRGRPDTTSLKNARVLVVDDQDDERTLLVAIFEHVEAEVRDASSVSDAFDVLSAWPAQLLVSDVAMSHEDGYVLLRRLRRTTPFEGLPVIAVTAHARPEDRDAALAAGFDEYVPKPIDTEFLLARASELLKRR
jgi:PAS domain S-box-containing protein